ncbi:DUF1542 domain-containing protein [Streptococcus suis]|uniref:DUF1542 domain-containing protein n=2 Tax=Streptococcus suis TaxID=1307 RepID=UPI002ACBEA81|nr:DUF1542 domain-containing protein [Streptococcus suis]WQE84852.1 DUF1542 domain-containing protein [Streptococcus suis]
MNRSKKKSFDWYGMRQRFSIRKYHIGAASVLLGMTLVLSAGTIVSAETGVNGDGTSNEQTLPVNDAGTSDGTNSTTQQQSDNQGNTSSGVQTGNTTNSTANVQPADDTGSASSQPVGTSRSANTGTQGDGTTNPTVAEPIMIIPSSASEKAPKGYVTVTFVGHKYTRGFTLGNQTDSSVKVFVKNGVTWGTLLDDPAWQWPTVKTDPGDTVVGWAVNASSTNDTYNSGNAFVRDKYRDEVVTDTSLYPNVVYEVEDVKTQNPTKQDFLGLYGPDEHNKWIFITFDAGKGQLKGPKTYKMVAVSNNLKTIDFSNSLFTKKVESPTLQGHTFVRWQTQDGKVLPKSGTITTETTYEALYLAHPQNQVAVFDSKKLTDSEKEQVKKNILDANPDLSTGVAQVIKAIDISDTGEATVTFDDKVVTVPSATLTNEDKDAAKSNAKAEIEKEATEKSDAINASNLTEEEKRARLTEVRDAQDRANIAIDKATTTEDLTKAISDGTAAIKAVSTTSTIKTKAKQALEEAYNAEKAEIENSVLTADEKAIKQAELTKAKENAIKAVDDAETDSAVEETLTNGKAAIESTYTAIIKIPSSASETAPQGYVTVTFVGHKYTRGFTLGNQTDSSVKVFVKNGVTWGTLLDDPAWQWPTVKTDEGDTVVGWGSHTNYSASVAFVYDKMKDQVVRNTQLWPNVVYEVEDVHSTIDAYLKQYGADEQDKWLFVTFDAGQGATLKGTTNQSKSVAVYYQNIGYDNSLFTKKVVNGVLANHTFVRWQTADGKVLPTSGTITSTEVYNALYLAHPTDKTTVFDANKLTETEKDSLKQAISNANPTSANLIQSITVSDTGEATVTYNDGTVVTVPATALIFEDKEPARNLAKEEIDDKLAEEKAAIEAKRDAAIAEINNTPGLTDDQKDAAKKAVTETAGKALTDLDTAADDAKKAIDTKTTAADFNDAKTAGEKALDDATATGEAAIELTKEKELAKADVDNQAKAAIEAIKNNPNLNEDEQAPYIQAVENATKEQKAAIDAAKDTAGITAAVNAAEKVNEEQQLAAAKEDAKDKIAEEAAAAKDAIDNNPNLSKEEKQTFKDAVDDAAKTANGEIDKATTPADAQTAEDNGVKAIDAKELDAAKQDAKNKIAKDLATVEAAIDANSNLSQDEKDAAKLAAQAKAAEAVANIEKATTPEAAQTLEDAAVKDLANIEIKAAYDDAVKAIEAADNLSTAAKTQALEDLKKARQAAEEAIKTASTADEVAKGALDGLKSLAKVEAKAAADDAKVAIAQNSNLTDAEKKVYTDAIDEALKDTETKIDDATDADTVDAETVLAQKDIAKQEVAAATADAVKGIEANTNLTDAEKDEYKATVTKAAETAEQAITDATTAADIQSKTFDATQDVAKEEVKADAADAIAGIKANDNLSDTAKEEAIAAIEEARDTTLENIENAKTAADVDAATLDAEKANAKAEIKAAAEDAKKAIDENANLPESEKTALKLAIDAEVAATNLEIDNAKTAEEIDAATLATEKSIAKAEVKAAAEDALQAIDENANLTDDEKAAAKADVYVELSKAEKAINKATTADAIDNATLVGEKAVAKEELKAAAEDAKAAIDANDNLTPEEKAAAKAAVDTEVAKANEAIDAATKADEVETATLAGEKAVAKEELKAAAEDAKKAIDANDNLTDAEKQAAKDAVDASAAAANKAIDGSTSSVEVQAAKDKGNAAIAENVLDAAKQGAKNKLMEEADKAKAAIDANPNLTPEEKAAAKAEIDKAVEEAIIAINGAGTHHALGEIKLPLSALIKPVVTVTPVLDPNNLTEEEIARIKALLEENNTFPEGTEIIVSKDASVSIKYPDGTIDLVLPAEIVKQADTTAPAITDDAKGNIVVAPTKEAVEFVVTYVDNNGKAQLVIVTKGADGKWTTTAKAVIVDPVTGQVIIPGSAIKPGTVVTAYSKDMAGNVSDLNSAEVEAVDANNPAAGVKVKSVTSTSNANKSTKKAKQLPNTGEKATSATSLGLAVLGMGLALFAAKRKKDEEEA